METMRQKQQRHKIELFKVLVEKLREGDFPEELIEFKGNHRFEIDEERFPIMSKEKHNLSAVITENPL